MPNNQAGWVDDAGSRREDDCMQAETPGMAAAAELTEELNSVLESATDVRVEQQIVDARDRLEDHAHDSLEEAFREASLSLDSARELTEHDHIREHLGDIRRVMVNLAGGGRNASV